MDVTQVGPGLEIRPDAGTGQQTFGRDAADDTAQPQAMFLHLLAVAVIPELTGKPLHGRVARGIAAEARRPDGAWSHDRGAGLDQVFDLAQQSDSHGG